MSQYLRIAIFMSVLLLDTALIHFFSAGHPTTEAAATADSATAGLPPVTSTPTTPATPTDTAAKPIADLHQALQHTSLADVEIPHSLDMNADGELIVNEGVRELIEFFLALDGEKSPADIRALFLAAAGAQCSRQCAAQALAIYDRYQDYLQAMRSATPNLQQTDDLRARLDMVENLRRTQLGDELSEALFGYDESYDQFRVAQWEIRNDTGMTDAEKQAALADLEPQQPAGLAQREQESRKIDKAMQLQNQIGTDHPTALYNARTELLGEAAAQRLASLDAQRAQWDQRYQQYRQELATLKTNGLAPADQQQEVERLRLRYFSQQESNRVAALDRIKSGTSY